MAAGTTDHAPSPVSISIAGMSSDHTAAATITPDAKPSSDFCRRSDIWSFIRNTNAEPSIVPSSGKSNPMVIVVIILNSFVLSAAKIRLFSHSHNT